MQFAVQFWFLASFLCFDILLAMMMSSIGQNTSFSLSSSIEKSTISYEIHELGYQPSSSSVDETEQSRKETPVYSSLSFDSSGHCQTDSEISELSEAIDDHSYSSEPSPSRWPIIKSGHHDPNIISRLGLKQLQHGHDEKPVGVESVDSGGLKSDSFFSCFPHLSCPQIQY